MSQYTFPFGQILTKVQQTERTPKSVFVLGVYASAVHAKWINPAGRVLVNALAVASEPYIFWKGDNAEKIISKIEIPKDVGTLIPANERFNGPSGKVLDDFFLHPLGLSRNEAWLCDLLPYSRLNPNQESAIKNHYNSSALSQFNLPKSTIPPLNTSDLNNPERRLEILEELEISGARTIILLGDLPIKYFISHYSTYTRLTDFLAGSGKYGERVEIKIEGRIYDVIPLVHPRQAGRLGSSNHDWSERHHKWLLEKTTPRPEFQK